MGPASNLSSSAWIRALLTWLAPALGLLFGLLASSPPQPLGPDADADQFSAGRALPVLERLLGDGTPHPVGSEANAAVRERLLAEIRALGLDPEVQETFACNLQFELCGEVANVIALLPGPDTGPVLLLTAHYDSAPAGPGVSDDLVGVTAILEAARHLLADGDAANRVGLLFSDGEEAGLLGATTFLTHPLAQDVALVVNAEARGSRGPSLLFETTADNAWLIRAFAAEARRPMTSSLLYQIYELLPNDTDLTEYKAAGMSGVNFAYVGGLPHYHTPLDDLEHLSLASFQHQGENVLAAARAYAKADLQDPPNDGAIFTYVAPGIVALAPLGWAVPLAVLGTLALVLAFLLARRRGQVTVLGWALGLVATLVAVGFAGLLTTGATGLLTLLRPESEPWYAQPLPTRVAVWALAITAVSLSSAVVARTASRWGLALGSWTFWALCTLAVAVLLPSASAELLLVLLVAAALLVIAAIAGPTDPLLTGAVSFVATAAAAYVFLPLARDLENGLGLGVAGAIAVVVALVAATSTPLLAGVRTYRPRRVALDEAASAAPPPPPRPTERPPGERRARSALLSAAAFAALFVAAYGISLATPAYTETWPRHVTLTHLEEWRDGERQAARWLALTEPSGPLPEELSAAADWQDPVAFPAWSTTLYHHAAATAGAGGPPRVEVISDVMVGSERQLRLRLGTTGAVLQTVLRLPPEAAVAEARFVGTPTSWDFRRQSGLQAHSFICTATSCDGRVVELMLRGDGPFEVVFGELLPFLPDDGTRLTTARGVAAVPSHLGDVSLRVHYLTLQ